MEYDPLSKVIDKPLDISGETLEQLINFRSADKFNDLPGPDTVDEKERLSKLINALLDRLISGIANNPSKLWVIQQFQPTLELAMSEDTEGREHFAEHLEQIMDIFMIESSDGVLGFYLG